MIEKIDEVSELDTTELDRHITGARRHLRFCAYACALSLLGIILLPLAFGGVGIIEYYASGITTGTISIFIMYCVSDIRIMCYERRRREPASKAMEGR